MSRELVDRTGSPPQVGAGRATQLPAAVPPDTSEQTLRVKERVSSSGAKPLPRRIFRSPVPRRTRSPHGGKVSPVLLDHPSAAPSCELSDEMCGSTNTQASLRMSGLPML